MRFGLVVPQGWRLDPADLDPADHWPVMKGLAQRADAGPWESVWVYDHLHTVPAPTQEATHEAWTLMAAVAATTGRVRLGQMCTCTGYRDPAHLAKVVEALREVGGLGMTCAITCFRRGRLRHLGDRALRARGRPRPRPSAPRSSRGDACGRRGPGRDRGVRGVLRRQPVAPERS